MNYSPILSSSVTPADFDSVWRMQMFIFKAAKLLVCSLTASIGNDIRSVVLNPTSNIRLSFKTLISALLSQNSSVANERPGKRVYFTARFKTFTYCYNIVLPRTWCIHFSWPWYCFVFFIFIWFTICIVLLFFWVFFCDGLFGPVAELPFLVWNNWDTAGKIIPQVSLVSIIKQQCHLVLNRRTDSPKRPYSEARPNDRLSCKSWSNTIKTSVFLLWTPWGKLHWPLLSFIIIITLIWTFGGCIKCNISPFFLSGSLLAPSQRLITRGWARLLYSVWFFFSTQ